MMSACASRSISRDYDAHVGRVDATGEHGHEQKLELELKQK